MITYQLEPGSVAHSVCHWFLRNPEEILGRDDINIKFGNGHAIPPSALVPAVEYGLLAKVGPTYRAGPKIAQLEPPIEVTPSRKRPGPTKSTPRPDLTPPDIAKVKVTMEPLAKGYLNRGRSKWNDPLNMVGNSPIVDGTYPTVQLRRSFAQAIKKAIRYWNQNQEKNGSTGRRLRCVMCGENCTIQRIS
jgi:hypothetical protein